MYIVYTDFDDSERKRALRYFMSSGRHPFHEISKDPEVAPRRKHVFGPRQTR